MDVRLPDTPHAAYISDLFEGEGHIALTLNFAHENHQLLTSISNTDKGLPDFDYKIIGTGKIFLKRVTRPHHIHQILHTPFITDGQLFCWKNSTNPARQQDCRATNV